MRIAIASVVGGIIAMVFGSLWYWAFAGQWQAAAGITQEQIDKIGPVMYLLPLVCWIIATGALNLLFAQLKDNSLGSLLRATVMVWAAGAMIATVLSTFFGVRGVDLYWIDGLHLLVALLILATTSKFIAHR